MQVFIRPAFFCAPQWLERKTTPHNHTETRERSVVQLWTISPHKKGNLKRSHVKIADTNYIFTNRKVRRSSDENVWTEKNLRKWKLHYWISLKHVVVLFLLSSEWLWAAAFQTFFRKNLLFKRGNLSPQTKMYKIMNSACCCAERRRLFVIVQD